MNDQNNSRLLPRLILRLFQLLAIITMLATFAFASVSGFQANGYYGVALYGAGGLFVAAFFGFLVLVAGQILSNLVNGAITYWPVTLISLCAVLYGAYYFRYLPNETTVWINGLVEQFQSKDQASVRQQANKPVSHEAEASKSIKNVSAKTNMPPQSIEPDEKSKCNIIQVQNSLTQLGFYSGTIDGAWGNQTSSAVVQYQTFQQLPVTGKLDPTTCQNIIDQVATTF